MKLLPELPRGELAPPAETDPYLPFPSAAEAGILGPEKVRSYPRRESGPIGSLVLQRRIPNHKGAGLVALSDGHIGAIDHVSAVVQRQGIYVRPSPKSAIDHDTGLINREGLVILTSTNMTARILSWVVDLESISRWECERLDIWQPRRGEPLGVAYLWSLEAPELRIWDFDPETGEQLLAPPRI